MAKDHSKRALPPIPHPDHLRKQAKARLVVMRTTLPTAKLGDAQAVIAREYGFANWMTLRAEVDRRVRSPMGQWSKVRRAHVAAFRPIWWHGSDGDGDQQEFTAAFIRAVVTAQIGFVLALVAGIALILWAMHATGHLPELPIYINL